jgi:hypothetical protein
MIPTFTTVLSAACATENGATTLPSRINHNAGISNCVYCAYLSITAAYFDSRNNNTQAPDVFVLAAHDTNLHHGFIRRLRH